jgi:hypothetical protein
MNNHEEQFRSLLNELPFDGSPRSEHRGAVREQSLLAFDEAATQRLGPHSPELSPRRSLMIRPAALLGFVAALAAFCGGVLALINNWLPEQHEVAQLRGVAISDEELVAALDLLVEFDSSHDDLTFDQGIQICLVDHQFRHESNEVSPSDQ